MSGYKYTVLNDNAITFITFDGDYVDSSLGILLASPQQILDEIGNQNPALLHVEHSYPPYGYKMGFPSLVNLEQTSQSSFCFSYINDNKIKAFLEIPNTSTYLFPNYGSFSLEFLFNKQDENIFISNEGIGGGYYFTRPILSKGNMCDVTAIFNSSGHTGFNFTFPSGNIYRIDNVYNKKWHCAMVWDVIKIDDTHYSATEMLMLNGKVYYQNTTPYANTFPSTQNTDSWLIGGTLNTPDSYYQDRNTSPLYFDQFAIYDYGLTVQQVATHYKKIYTYDDMILNDNVVDYFPLRDANDSTTMIIENYVAARYITGNNGLYYGTSTNLLRAHDASDLMIETGTVAPYFLGNSMGYFTNNQFDLYTNDYAIEFWFKTSQTTTGTLFAYNNNYPPFEGIEITINEKNSVYQNGVIQVTENVGILNSLTNNIITNAPIAFNDGFWHHLVYQRNSTTTQLWLDATLHSSLTGVVHSNVNTGLLDNIFIMGNRIRNKYVMGQMSKLARYNFYLQPQQIQSRYSYTKIYRLKGIITLQGIPTRATVRIFDNFTGKLIGEVTSNVVDGSYEFDLPNNSAVDIMVFDRLNPAVKYRAYGTIIPTGESDFPITI